MDNKRFRVALLGDSIRLGYEATVRTELADIADIWSPAENCMHSVHHLFNLSTYYVEPKADLIHMNFGLWDCRRLDRNRNDNAIPVEIFVRNLDFILGKIRGATSATIIWATITPVVQSRYNARFSQSFEPCRDANDVELYNAAAVPVLSHHGVIVNDLHALVERHGREKLIGDDGVHYTDAGCALLGREVAAVIRNWRNNTEQQSKS